MAFHLTDPRAWGRVKSRHSFLWPPPHSLPHPGVYTPDGQGSGIDYYDLLYALARGEPALDLNFKRGTLYDQISGDNLITFTRAGEATDMGADGLIKTVTTDVPRITYDPVTHECLGMLFEGARTNLLLRSEEFGTTWTISDATVSSDAVSAPDGSTTLPSGERPGPRAHRRRRSTQRLRAGRCASEPGPIARCPRRRREARHVPIHVHAQATAARLAPPTAPSCSARESRLR